MVEIVLKGTKEENRRVLDWLDKQPVKCMRTSRPYTREGVYGKELVNISVILLDEHEKASSKNEGNRVH